jgi:ATP-dependent Clp protease, protease subunit
MQFIKPDVATYCMGLMAASAAAVLLAGGSRGQALRPAPRTDHAAPAAHLGSEGQATDIEIHAREILKVNEEINQILATTPATP